MNDIDYVTITAIIAAAVYLVWQANKIDKLSHTIAGLIIGDLKGTIDGHHIRISDNRGEE